MKYFLLILGSLFLFLNPAQAREKVKETIIEGTVLEAETGSPLQQATVRLLTLADSSLIKGTVAATGGKFSMSVRESGTFLISISFIGFETLYRRISLPAQSGKLQLGRLKISESSLLLQEAIVEGKAPDIVLKEDTVEYNADSYKLPASSMVEDLVKKLPGVEIDEDGNITAGGKTISKILVDGKEFFGNDIQVALKNINAELLDKLQVIDRKSEESRLTGIDDGEEEKIINLTIKKGMKKGWFGNLSGSYGSRDRYESSAMANRFVGNNQYSVLGGINNTNNAGFSDMGNNMYAGSNMRGNSGGGLTTAGNIGSNFFIGNSEKLEVGGNLIVSGKDDDVERTTIRENFLKDRSTFYDQDYSASNRSRNVGSDFRVQWKIDSLTRLDFAPSFQYNKSNSANRSLFSTRNEDNSFVNQGNSHNETEMDGYNYSARLTVSRESARKKGRRTSLSLSVNGNRSEGTSFQNSYTLYGDKIVNPAGVRDTTVRQKQTELSDKNGFRIRLSYVEPFGNKRFLQFAYTLNRSKTNSDRFSYNWDEVADAYSTLFDSIYSDRFENVFLTQNINLNVRTVREKYNYTIGLNVDPSYTKSINYFDSDRSFSRSVVNLGPAGEFAYLWNRHHNLRIQYRGRTQQPSINQLQPSKNITNPLNIRIGNLDLKPTYQNHFSVRYNKYVPDKQQSIQATLQGRLAFNSIVNQTNYDEQTGVQTTKPVNVNGVWYIEGMNMINTPLKNKKFQLSNNIRVSFNQQIGFTNAQRNVARTYGVRENLGIRYNSKIFDVGLRGNYSFSQSANSIAEKKDQTVMNYGATVNFMLYLPWSITAGSDFSYRGNQGYAASMARTEMLWNAFMNVEFLKQKQATAFIRAYDLLHQRSTLSRRVTANYIEDVESNLLTNYFLVGFTYRFNTMGKGSRKGQQKEGKEEIRGTGRPPRPYERRPMRPSSI